MTHERHIIIPERKIKPCSNKTYFSYLCFLRAQTFIGRARYNEDKFDYTIKWESSLCSLSKHSAFIEAKEANDNYITSGLYVCMWLASMVDDKVEVFYEPY